MNYQTTASFDGSSEDIIKMMRDASEQIKIQDPWIPNKFYKESSMVERKQFRFPRSKSKRIRKKWSKQQKNWKEIPLKTFIALENVGYVGHPETVDRFMRGLN